MKRILFLIHDLGQGGAEKVLVNLVNNMDRTKFDISVTALFGGGVNEQFLKPDIHYRSVFPKSIPGNSHWMKMMSPAQLHKLCVKDQYDIEVSYLEGPSARVISGCKNANTKLVSWIHIEQHTAKCASASFRSFQEAEKCYQRFDRIIAVSEYVKNDFSAIYSLHNPVEVLYNTNETKQIMDKGKENASEIAESKEETRLIAVGKILLNKGFDRLARIHMRLRNEGYGIHTYILGIGPEQENIEKFIAQSHMTDSFTFLGYQTNPYRYVAKSDLFICASLREGFSTAATEALILGVPVCTVEVSGMKEMLGEHNEYGVVTENNEEALYQGIKKLLDDSELLEHYKKQAEIRGKDFSTENTVKAVENMLINL